MILRTILLTLICITPALAEQKDLVVIRQLPERLAAMKKEGHKKWDTGVTGTMLEGTFEFNQGLIKILKDLVRSHCKGKIIKVSDVDTYIQTLEKKLEFEQTLGNPRGVYQGSLGSFEIPSGLSVELQEAIAILVRGIVEDDESFDYFAWRTNWRQASTEGD